MWTYQSGHTATISLLSGGPVDEPCMPPRTTDRTPIASRPRDNGFTLVELLVVVIVIGLLAAIAIPVFLNQRKKGIDASIKSDLRSAAHAVEAWNADNTTDRDGPAAAGTPLSNYTAGSDTLASTIALPGGSIAPPLIFSLAIGRRWDHAI